jgi:glycerol-3-phosphate dehydrogenase (NAD(P)+)
MKGQATKVGIISAGSWGTALGVIANRAGSKVSLFTRNANVLESITSKRTNNAYLPGVFLDPRIDVTDNLTTICKSDILIIAIPSQHMRATCISISDQLDMHIPIVLATKGIERGSLALMSEVVRSVLPNNPVAILTGPNFATEAAQGLPTAASIACEGEDLATRIIYSVGGKFFRPYHTDDLIGAQIGGAVKNVIAIACGISLGCGFGENARAAIITRGITEMTRLCIARGGRQETLMGLSGIGDLVLTCTSTTSRNMSLGIDLGKKERSVKATIEAWQKRLAEGVTTSDSVTELAKKIGISMPICQAVRDILFEHRGIDETIQQLLERPFVSEVMQTSF